ncbi:hypothetical protein FRC07_008017 [Ceratobasidium sp. 392]|nr:hypothetical protein FRC07_008017 [Ceratobasidium sp. 392]
MNNDATFNFDAKMMQEFAEFQAWKAVKAGQARTEIPQASEPDRRAQSPTLGRSSNPMPPDDSQRGRDTRRRALAMSSDDNRASEQPLRDDSESPPPRDRTVRAMKPGRNPAPKLPPSTPPVTPQSDEEPDYPSTSRTRRSSPSPLTNDTPPPHRGNPNNRPPSKSRRQGRSPSPRYRRMSSPHPSRSPSPRRGRSPSPRRIRSPPAREGSPGDGPWPYSRDASQERPLLSSSNDTPDHAPGPGEAADAVSDEEDDIDENPYRHPYDQTPTSHVSRTNQVTARQLRGGRKGRTYIERLGDRLSKHIYTREHMHPFALKHGLAWFDPYAIHKAPVECYEIVSKPKELVGGPGRGKLPLHEAAGMRMDMDYWNKIMRGVVKDALAKYAPKNLAPNVSLTWTQYGSGARKAVFTYCYNYIPMFQHFRNQAQGDCWLIALIAQQHLQGRPKLATSKKLHPDMRPNEDGFQDSYLANARAHGTGSDAPPRASALRAPAPNSHHAPANFSRAVDRGQAADLTRGRADPPRSRTNPPPASLPRDPAAGTSRTQPASNARRSPATHSPAPDDYDDYDEPQTAPDSNSSHTYNHPPASTERQNRKADKQTAAEEARAKAKASDSRALKNKAQASTTLRASGKSHAKPPQEPLPAVEEPEESEGDEAIHSSAKKVKAGPREHAKAKSPEPETQKAAKITKKGGAQSATKAPPKTSTKPPAKTPAKRKANEEQESEREELAPAKKRTKTQQKKRGGITGNH